jgi:hypothetical protein
MLSVDLDRDLTGTKRFLERTRLVTRAEASVASRVSLSIRL